MEQYNSVRNIFPPIIGGMMQIYGTSFRIVWHDGGMDEWASFALQSLIQIIKSSTKNL